MPAPTEQSSLSVPGTPTPAAGAACDEPGAEAAEPLPIGTEPGLPHYDFAELYESQFDFVWRSLRLLGVPPEAAEDATQDVFSVASRQLGRFEGRSSIRTWLFAILQRVAANYRRTARRKLNRLEPLEDAVVSPEPSAHARAEASQALDVVQRYCETLDLDRRALFVLVLIEELPAPEVSLVLGVPVNTVYSRVRTLREGLRRALGEAPHG